MRAHVTLQGRQVPGSLVPVDVGLEVTVEILVRIEFRTAGGQILHCENFRLFEMQRNSGPVVG